MGKVLVTVFFSALSILCMAEEKIAVTGDSNEAKKAADLISVGLSSQYSVMERGEIEKIFKEKKLSTAGISSKEIVALSKTVHADYFIIINSSILKKKTMPSRLLLFNAANGFRLLDKSLPENIEKAAEYSVEEIKKALSDSQKTEGRKFLSVLSVRNAGAPKKYEADFANIAIEVERGLASAPGVAILERESLGMVNQERKISESFSKLTTSGYLLDFEFLPGPEVSHVDLTLNILESAGKQVSQIKVDNCLKDPKKTIETVLAGLSKFLSMPVPPTSKVSDKKEAERFFNEYKFCDRISDMNSAERKLEAAIALNPDSPHYRIELASFIMKKADTSNRKRGQENAYFNTSLDVANRALDILDETKERFPDYKKSLYSDLKTDLLNNQFSSKILFSKETINKAHEFAERYRPLYGEEIKRLYYQFDLSDGINSLKELEDLQGYYSQIIRLGNYMDRKRAAEASLKASKEILKYGGDFLRENPDILKDMSYEKQGIAFVLWIDSDDQATLENMFKNSAGIVELAMDHPSPAVNAYGLELDVFRKAVLNNFDPEKFSRDMGVMLKGIEKLKVPPTLEAIDSQHRIFSSFLFFYYHHELGRIFYWKQIEYMRKQNQIVSWPLVNGYLPYSYKNTPQFIAEAVEKLEPEIRYWKKNKSTRYNQQIENCLLNWARSLYRNRQEYARALKILEAEPSTKVEKIFSLPRREHYTKSITEKNGKVYFLANLSSPEGFVIYSLDPGSGKTVVAGKAENITLEQAANKHSYTEEIFCVSEKYFLIGGAKAILVIPRNKKSPYLIEDLPAENVNALAVMNGRIYAFLGRTNYPGEIYQKETVLASFRPDGSDRKIHISTLEREKKGFFDKKTPFFTDTLFADKKRLIFTAGKPASGLWEFNPETGKEKLLMEIDKYATKQWGVRFGDTLYLACGVFMESFYTYDLKKDKADFVFFSGDRDRAKRLKERPAYISEISQLRAPFFCRVDQFWFGCAGINIVNPTNLSTPERLNIRTLGQTSFCPHPDGVSVYAFSGDAVYKLTPQ